MPRHTGIVVAALTGALIATTAMAQEEPAAACPPSIIGISVAVTSEAAERAMGTDLRAPAAILEETLRRAVPTATNARGCEPAPKLAGALGLWLATVLAVVLVVGFGAKALGRRRSDVEAASPEEALPAVTGLDAESIAAARKIVRRLCEDGHSCRT